jgi:formamidopyrimidine-DNA glycosylase
VKAALLDQRTLAGLGNIYVDEALWRARIHPLRPARELDPDEVRALREGIKRALEAGIKRQGATLRDYRQPDGSAGSMQNEFKVYGRWGNRATGAARRSRRHASPDAARGIALPASQGRAATTPL